LLKKLQFKPDENPVFSFNELFDANKELKNSKENLF